MSIVHSRDVLKSFKIPICLSQDDYQESLRNSLTKFKATIASECASYEDMLFMTIILCRCYEDGENPRMHMDESLDSEMIQHDPPGSQP